MVTAKVPGYVVALPDDYTLPLTSEFATLRHRCIAGRSSNLSAKRNLGLLIAHLMGVNVFFCDDDIRGISVHMLKCAQGALEDNAIAGFLANDFPDNSVVRHAYRLTGGDQATFLSGNALAVNIMKLNAFFPNIYAEDWLFCHDAVEAHTAVSLGEVRQLRYDPFDPKRAASEEFGCVLATEGLYSLLAMGASFRDATYEYWDSAIKRRRDFIDDVTTHLSSMPGNDDSRISRVRACLSASRIRLDDITPKDLIGYVKAWRDDIARWQDRLTTLPAGLSLDEAISYLRGLGFWH